MDDIDREILRLLQEDGFCGPKVTDIAKKLRTTPATISRRLKKLEKERAIKGYSAELDPKQFDEGLTNLVVLKMDYAMGYSNPEKNRLTAEKLASIPEVKEVHICGGDWDYLIKVRVKDADAYYNLSQNVILPMGGVERSESFVAYRTFKDTNKVKL